jgi:two-component system sensor histidine kinase PilS (NtrC family)
MSMDLKKGIRALIAIRIIVITILLGSFYFFRVSYDRLSHPLYFSYFIASLYMLTICYALALRWIRKPRHIAVFTYLQIIVDVVAETILIYLTGGIESMFSFLFPLSVISAAIVLNRRACYIIATLSSIFYGLLLDLQYYGIIQPLSDGIYSEKDFFYKIFAHVTAFYLIAYLSGHLSDKLHKARQSLEERDTVLSDLKAYSKYIIESMPSGVFTTDLNMRIISFNNSAQDITHLSQEDVIGKTPGEIFPFLKDIGRPTERTEGEIRRKDELFPIGMRLSSLRDSAGNEIGLIGIFQDLTELKAMEAEVKRKEKWAFIGELSASIAHELRNPLASLKASVEMLRERKVSGDHADHLMNIALSEMDRLNGIITDFLLYAKPQELHKENFDVHESLRDVVTLLKNIATEEKNVTIAANLEGSLPFTGDPRQIKQVFWNLGINAIDSVSEEGSVHIQTVKRDSAVEISFTDTGIGISHDDMDKIFYPFFTTKDKGTGLGLSIAQKIIEEHRGKVAVESGGNGRGTTIKIILPLVSA